MIYPSLPEIGEKARERRKQRGLTQEAAARAVLCHRNEISEIENGRFTGSLATFMRYLHSLGMDIDWTVRERPTLDELDKLFPEEDED